MDTEVEDATGKIVYRVESGSTEHAILWVWRELLLSSIVYSGDEILAKVIVNDIKKMGYANKMLQRLADEISRA